MKKFWNSRKRASFAAYHIDRVESSYGNLMLRGWAVNRDKEQELKISVRDDQGMELRTYQERLIRPDVNETFGEDMQTMSGFHIVVERADINTPNIWLTFEHGAQSCRHRIRVNSGTALERFWRSRSNAYKEVPDYDLWIRKQEPSARERRRQRKASFSQNLKFSVVIPLYNTPPVFLKAVLDSVLHQTYPNVELCLADGSTSDETERYIAKHYAGEKRIRYCRLEKNGGISENTNAALQMAQGDFIVFADHDDVLTVDALYEMAKAVEADPQIDVIYTDEDKVNRSGTAYFGPHFKPDFSMELLQCNNYICHLFAVRREVQERTGMLDSSFDGAQDYDFVLRCCEQAKRICHIPKVLYHWRTHPESTAGNPASKLYAFEAGRRAVEAHYQRMQIEAEVEATQLQGRYRTHFMITGSPWVTILIPNKDHSDDLRRCIESIQNRTSYQNYEILIVENNSVEPETEAYYAALAQEQSVRLIRYEGGFNYAAIHNFAMKYVNSEYVVLLNNDTEVRTPNWLEELLGICQQETVGAVGAKLFYPDGTIQHAGVILGLCGVASHWYVGMPGDRHGYAARLVSVQDLSAVTAACMMTKKSVWEKLGGMSEELAVAYNDIDYCLKLRQAGCRVVFTPYAELIHYESKSRGPEDTPEKQARFRKEAELFSQKWKQVLDAGDPFYNPNLTRTRTDCVLRKEERK